MQFVRQSKFRHVYCKPIKHEFCLQDVRITKVSWDSLFCDVNPKVIQSVSRFFRKLLFIWMANVQFIAVITEGSGGPFVVVPIGKVFTYGTAMGIRCLRQILIASSPSSL